MTSFLKNPLEGISGLDAAVSEAFDGLLATSADVRLRIPLLFNLDDTSDDVWASWVGSRKSCERIASTIVKMKTQHSLSKATLKRSSFGVVLTTCLFGGKDRYEECLSALSPADAKLVDIDARSAACIRDSIRAVTGRDPSDLDVKTIIELIRELSPAAALSFSLGVFNRRAAMSYVALHCLSERTIASKSFAEKVQIQFALFNELSGISKAELAICKGFALHPVIGEFISIGVHEYDHTSGDTNNAKLADVLTSALAIECVNYKLLYDDDQATIARRLRRRIEGWVIANEQMPRTLELLYGSMRKSVDRVLKAYDELSGLECAAGLELELRSFKGLPDLEFTQEKAYEASKLVIGLNQKLEASQLWSAAALLSESVDDASGTPDKIDVQDKIKAIVESGVNAKNIAQLTALTMEAEQIVKRQQGSVSQAANLIKSSLDSFESVIGRLSALSSDHPKEPGPDEAVATVAPVEEKSRDQEVEELHELLDASSIENQQIVAEMRKVKEDLHKAKALNAELVEAKSAAQLPAFGSEEIDLIRRIGMREKVTPVDVLEYYRLIAGERVVILESAIKSAQDSKHFAYCDRMIDMVGSLCFQYLDSINAGNPDSVAREVFASDGYSARESETVLADSRLRAMREFIYQGETCLFKRHLRIGTGKGAANGMRIYFEMIDKKVVIAYAGAHLEVSSSN